MIEAIEVSKQFDDIKAVDNISARIKEGNVFGLVGTNGAGKSTFLRLISGILKPDTGKITIDGMEVYENVMAKELFFYISDEQFFFNNSTPKDLKKYYSSVYKHFDGTRFENLINQFELKLDRKINTFSKGMKKQLSVISGICANTKYLFC
ncbi:MAG TPA: ATP-binding cassette domain-containing protein, partial [Lachnospiraceae bacterium]|nr:ATP-binding cassette domain-containing protein [Lachnospiraceae bacterium]